VSKQRARVGEVACGDVREDTVRISRERGKERQLSGKVKFAARRIEFSM